MFQIVQSLIQQEQGRDPIEYALLAAFLASLMTVALLTDPLGIKLAVVAAYQRTADVLRAQ
ncbi:MAG TPA: hypothetical protein VEY91_03605 [Candidatus Limnocylindria bacterium]|nr:hypothetical protein [Candidatus Limnocylindria bacterium]